ncbi:hypothetical protein QBC42DRAFT_275309 [Cladorrhinum samala]|uniref:Rad60/SUMO-like domain-containing protein n=1 Tax=Cladorrhinum samala TaxID=585594 RepID=A0AAV9HHA8_9PEZI|nr:hypothetical protein QBC42DRAFT_275309 [Cladorrhinum samala]
MATDNRDVEAVEPAEVIEPPKKKRGLPFKRPVARKQTPDATSAAPGDAADFTNPNKAGVDELDLFRHSKQVFEAVARKVEEERQASLTPEKTSRKRKSSPDEDSADGARKRQQSSSSSMARSPTTARRFSALDDSDDDEIVMDVKGKGKEVTRSSRRFTPRKAAAREQTSSTMSSPGVVVIDDSDDEGGAPIGNQTAGKTRAGNPNLHNPSPDSSPIEVLSKRVKSDDDDDDDDDEEEEDKPAEEANEDDEWARKALEMRKLTEQEAVVFMVTSRFPNTGPIKVRRRLVQDFSIIIDTWVTKQLEAGVELPENTEMFATWKGQKIYKYSSLASLGIRMDERGRPKAGNGEEGYFYNDAGMALGVHLEIWDEQLYNNYLEQKTKERALRLGVLDEDYAAESEGESPEPEPKKKFKVVLKAKEYEPLKMSVLEDTTVEFMIDAFCQQRHIDNDWAVAIYFDGEKLDEDSLVVDADIDPDETNQFEVHIKV